MTSTYNDLLKTYQGFIAPSYSIVVNHSLTISLGESPFVDTLEVELTAGYEAGACNIFFFEGVEWDATQNTYTVSQEIRNHIKLGNQLEVKLGYGSELKTVFKGFITAIELYYEADSGFQVIVESMDAKRLMMNNYRSNQPRTDLKNYSEAVREILKKYAPHLGSQNINITQERNLPFEQHNQSDYDFLVSLAKRVNYAFYMINNDVYFEEYAYDTKPLLELHAHHLHSFSREMTLADQIKEVTVRSNDEQDPNNVFEATANTFKAIGKGTKDSHGITNITSPSAQKIIIDTSVSSNNEAKSRAEAELARHAFKFAHGTFKTLGIPEIMPGKMITITGFGEEYDNDYFLKKVTHSYTSSGFTTKGELGVNKI